MWAPNSLPFLVKLALQLFFNVSTEKWAKAPAEFKAIRGTLSSGDYSLKQGWMWSTYTAGDLWCKYSFTLFFFTDQLHLQTLN